MNLQLAPPSPPPPPHFHGKNGVHLQECPSIEHLSEQGSKQAWKQTPINKIGESGTQTWTLLQMDTIVAITYYYICLSAADLDKLVYYVTQQCPIWPD